MEIGIVGLPNVGKSSLFNALTGAAAAAENFPFTTIEPNIGVVPLPDERLQALAQEWNSAKVTPSGIRFVDIAGIVEGASQGEGLGNKFLGHIRSEDSIAKCNALNDCVKAFNEGIPARKLSNIPPEILTEFQFLTAKPLMYVANT